MWSRLECLFLKGTQGKTNSVEEICASVLYLMVSVVRSFLFIQRHIIDMMRCDEPVPAASCKKKKKRLCILCKYEKDANIVRLTQQKWTD